ncbi:hypothetical protein P389DRAFT_152020 [Cystobasidium minutum MCA 4210]|uniref:uncharacterized protein n=1 Tax=Cystobasidium minutum MCA 4210 TaxID=1397322 RepID=UPI0034CEFF7C|eukprot:jgi/Rhomi1/152020/estExt_Genewise1.C_3_t30408
MEKNTPPVCLTIAGSDSGGGAGIQADLSTFSALSCYGTSAITAITAQNTRGVDAVQGISPDMLSAQINSLFADIPPAAIKTGMLYSAENIEAVVKALEANCTRERCPPIVIDPVMVSTSGHTLLQDEAISTLSSRLLPLATVVTPNTPEAEILGGLERGSIKTIEDMKRCAKAITKLGVRYVLVKGGHLPPHSTQNGTTKEMIIDILYDSKSDNYTEYSRPKMQSRNTHGTGCTLSAAICAELAKGKTVQEAVDTAGSYVIHAIATAFPLGSGSGPVNHGHTKIQRQLPAPHSHSPHPFTDYLIAQTGDLWQKYVFHPFVVQLGKGTLPMKAFLHFIRQDYSFLFHYARTNALAAYKAKTFEDLAGSNFIVQTVLHEVQMHIEFCESQGITKDMLENTKESVTNIAYNRYVLDVSNSGDILDLRVATAPCLLGYGEVGQWLLSKPDSEVDRTPNNRYYKWAINYGKEDFQTAVVTGRAALEKMVADAPLSKARLAELVEIFRQTTELEIAFWDTAMEAANEP